MSTKNLKFRTISSLPSILDATFCLPSNSKSEAEPEGFSKPYIQAKIVLDIRAKGHIHIHYIHIHKTHKDVHYISI